MQDGPSFKVRVALMASEAVPFSKTGGLADVAGSLPPALERLGHEPIVFVPFHRRAMKANIPIEDTGVELSVPIGSRTTTGRLLVAKLPNSNVDAYLIDRPELFDRDTLYGRDGSDFADNCERFVFFQRAALEAIRLLELRVDVIHCNDWQTGLVPVYLDEFYRQDPAMARIGTVLTIHNMAYQGRFWHWDVPVTGLSWRLFNWRELEHYGSLNFLKAGLVFADRLNTVSPTYAREIQGPELGCGLDGLLRQRAADLSGVVNGIDTTAWNPSLDALIPAHFDVGSIEVGKAACKAHLQGLAGLPARPDVPLFAQIGRLDSQKGWELLAEAADVLLGRDVQLVVLGEGHPRYHELLGRLSERHPGKLRAFLEFSNTLAHQIEAGADAFLMPSLYEPCGLNQLYSQAYGTVPIVHATGGLVDTVVDASAETLADDTATGFAFREPTSAGLMSAVDRALRAWPNRETWLDVARAGMRVDWSWDRSAVEYVRLYRDVRARRTPRLLS